jgi:DNA repair exonuclease SbcCD ATPase subunit
MTINDFIKDLEEIIEENKNIDEEQLGLIYCDDTECIEEHKSRLNQYLSKCEQLVKYLNALKEVKHIIERYDDNADDLTSEDDWYLDEIKYLLEDVK